LDDKDNRPQIELAMREALRRCESGKEKVDIEDDWLSRF
jgi:hypothetical protein